MTSINVATLVVAFVNFLLGGIIYIHSRRKASENFFALIAFSTSLWCLGAFLVTAPFVSHTFYVFGAFLHYIFGNLIFLLLFWFAYYFPKPTNQLPIIPIIATILDFIFFLALIFTQFLFKEFLYSPLEGSSIVFNPVGYSIYALFILTIFITAELALVKKYRTQVEENRTHIKYVIWGTALASAPALITNLVLPGFTVMSLFSIGPIFAVPWVVIIGYAIFKHNLLNIKIIATEFFVTLIVTATALEMLFADTLSEFLLRFMLFSAVSILSYLIIRSVLKEIQTRQQIELLAGQLQAANKELARINQAKSDFLSMASHQLKTPLSIIKGYVSMTLEGSFGKITKKIKEQLEKVFISNERLISLVEDLLNLSRVEEGRMKYDWTNENISDIVQQVVEEVRMAAEQKHLRMVWMPPTEKLIVRVDLNKIRNVIFNLLDNAIKYTAEGAITVTAARHNQSMRVSVADTGRGISSSEIKKLFTKFTRVFEGKSNLTTSGFGLGLYVARLIVEEHKGRVWVESAGLGKGSTFVLELPLVDLKPEPRNLKLEKNEEHGKVGKRNLEAGI